MKKLKNENQTFLYLGTVSGESVKGSSDWYSIAVDSLLDDKKNIMSKSESIKDIVYHKQHHIAYVHSSEFNITKPLKNHGEGWTFYPTTQKWAYKDNSGWAYGLKEINGYPYYFDGNGYSSSGWIKNADKHYFFEKNGTLKTGWHEENQKSYYLNPVTGVMQTQWSQIDGVWHYFNSSGAMLKGWQSINGNKYNLGLDGK